ncbi:Hypothetical protein PHPALM_20879 [Phytophthora palmivora]|uniref:Uncharacterized protein n=1 Tax=Phytophthora palmivora TaxID=4796 RepID=A0A2P4XDR6_9STRA|nr:Hypothetical protein PHPALM_20879 [Phytophthora palmivora]
MSLEYATQFVRGEGSADSKPNKYIDPGRLRVVLHGYQQLGALVQIAEKGIDAEWRQGPRPRRPPPKLHGSCRRYMRAGTRSSRIGQVQGNKSFVNTDILERWSDVICNPLVAVEKKVVSSSEDVRIIHDLPYPSEGLHNAGDVGRIRILKGDVKSVLRHLRIRARHVFRVAAIGLDIDMTEPFGWAGSPPCYALFGRAITWLMGSNSPSSVSDSSHDNRFFPYEWVADHILIDPDIKNRLELAEATLRHAMLTVLGRLKIFKVERGNSVSIPEEKIAKAREQVITMKQRETALKSELFKLLDSLRHILQSQYIAAPRFKSIRLSNGAKADLVWFVHILSHGYLAELPLTMFGTLTPPHVVYMDASNIGL